MNNFKHTLFYIIAIFLLISFIACENDVAKVNSITSASDKMLPMETGKNVEIMYSDSALVRAKLSAAQMDRYAGEKPYMELPKGVQVIFYDEQRNEQTKLTADYGIGYDDGKGMNRMEAKRNVVVINEKGDRLNTEHLIWDVLTKKIYTKDFVKITTKDETIWGDGLEANEDFSEYEITHPKGSIAVDEEELSGGKKEID